MIDRTTPTKVKSSNIHFILVDKNHICNIFFFFLTLMTSPTSSAYLLTRRCRLWVLSERATMLFRHLPHLAITSVKLPSLTYGLWAYACPCRAAVATIARPSHEQSGCDSRWEHLHYMLQILARSYIDSGR